MRRSFNLSPSLDFCNLLHPGEKIYRSQFYWFYAYKPGKCQKSVYISSPNWLHVTMSACKKIRFWQKFSFFEFFFFWNFLKFLEIFFLKIFWKNFFFFHFKIKFESFARSKYLYVLPDLQKPLKSLIFVKK